MNAHTPTPWQELEHDSSDISSAEWWDIPGIASVHSEQDAAFIVRACNTYQRHIDALELIAAGIADPAGIARAALAHAGEGA